MEAWELFIKGLAKSFEDFAIKMIEKGRLESSTSGESSMFSSSQQTKTYTKGRDAQPAKRGPKKRKIRRRDLGALEGNIINAIKKFPTGCTLKDIAKILDMQWHFLRIPLRQLVEENKLIKDGKIYNVAGTEEITPDAPVKKASTGVRRRIVDERDLKAKLPAPVMDPMSAKMSSREKEILKFKVLTAFRGRPEGLTLVELAAVLGRNKSGLDIIISELITEKKVLESKGEKFRLC